MNLKYFFLFFTLSTSLSGSTDTSVEERTIGSTYSQLVTFIGQQQFKVIGQTGLTGTYTISNPGIYALSNDINATTASGQTIYIASSNVIFDLAGQSIMVTGSTGAVINCFTLAPSLSNIIIKNGIISAVNGTGIYISPGCTNIRLEDLNINNCALSGITVNGTALAPITGCSLKDCRLLQCNSTTTHAYGLKLLYCNLFKAKSCYFGFQQTTATACNSYGVYISGSQNNTFESCSALGNSGPAVAAGFYVDTGCSNITFTECIAKTNTSSGTGASSMGYGFYEKASSNNRFENCISASNTGYALGAGFYAQNCSYNYFLGCIAHNNTNTGISGTIGGYGFLANTATCRGNMYDTCTAFGNSGSADTASYGCGFSLDSTLCATITNCLSQANNGVSGTGIGIELKAGATRCCIQNNTVTANTSTTKNNAYGISDVSNPSTNLLRCNFAFANRDESSSPVDQNYNTSYSNSNIIQTAAKTNIKGLSASTFLNTNITP